MRELSEVMGGAVEARASSMSGLTPGARLATVKAQVRRRRVTRHVLEGAASLAVVGAVVVAGWFGLGDRNGPPPVATPTPSISPTLAPTPTPEVTETPEEPEIVLGDPIDEPGLPTYYAMPDGLLEETGPGWVLATYAPEAWDAASQWFPPAAFESILLVSPDGVTYEVLRLGSGAPTEATSDGRWAEHELLGWESGRTTAVVRETVYALVSDGASQTVESTRVMTLDLLTGSLTPLAEAPVEQDGVLNSRGDLRLVWGSVSSGAVVDVATGAEVASLDGQIASGWCEAVVWWTAESILAVCRDGNWLTADLLTGEPTDLELNPRLVTFDLAQLSTGEGTVLRALTEGDPLPFYWGNDQVSDGVVVVQASTLRAGSMQVYDCPSGVYLIDGDSIERLPASDSHPDVELNLFAPEAIGRTIYVEATGGCSGDGRPSILTSYNLDSRAFIELIGPPPRRDAAAYAWLQGLTSYAVGR